ncbi:LPXTG cell wall anchor domain-containing protein [uncultured Cellulomonas sp.]|uniref:LPXTG cell wall anchor domain-containing protein n=1 Tax=uncultured Cellulomonas sp. TaxID=189682 RepID=UPI002619BD0F|nr:LPXTG cell wall anchor domain-containing protein [uncultured Cellulomonas sp.]
MRRAFSVVAATMFAVGGLAGTSATAAELPLCEEGDGYVPGETCESVVLAELDCPDGVATIDYDIAGTGDEDGLVDVTWTGLPGGDVTVTGQPLTGTLTWPTGVTADATIVFGTTPPTALLAEYPCDDDSGVAAGGETPTSRSTTRTAVAARSESGVLAQTGATGLPIALGGGALIVGGAAAVILARRSRQAGAAE